MEIKNGILAKIYSMAIQMPPKISQRRLARVFIDGLYSF
jgi:hypothetical protein